MIRIARATWVKAAGGAKIKPIQVSHGFFRPDPRPGPPARS
jgi:hypothetical protein